VLGPRSLHGHVVDAVLVRRSATAAAASGSATQGHLVSTWRWVCALVGALRRWKKSQNERTQQCVQWVCVK
jgi:hypothetical protein